MSAEAAEILPPPPVETSPVSTPPKELRDEIDPWHDDAADNDKTFAVLQPHRLETPDPSTLDNSVLEGLNADVAGIPPRPMTEILGEFDPLTHQEEVEAREAWENSETHPPPPRPLSPSTPTVKEIQLESPPPTAASLSSFASLTAFTRNFSIPGLPRPRPLSLDTAQAVVSPATLSSLAALADPTIRRSLDDEARGRKRSSTVNDSGTESPQPGRSRDSNREREEQPFDFQKFLDQMKLKSTEPIAKYLKSFLSNFAKRNFTTTDQIKIIHDFLHFISEQMRNTDVWRNATDSEFDNAMEGMEKLVMNRLYDFTFTPQLPLMIPRRPVTTDDLERDRILSQRIALFGWIEEKHLDIPEGEGSKGFLMFAQQELVKINHYKAPRDKLICILNCCKVIFGLIRHLRKDEGADAFVPILIFVVLKANPDHLLSNVEFINRFRNPEKLQSEAGYYLSSLMGAVSFIETLDHTSLSNITQEEFEKNVEETIPTLPPSEPQSPMTSYSEPVTPYRNTSTPTTPLTSPHAGEESAHILSLPTPAQTLTHDARRLLQKTGDTISKPLNAIGRIFSEALDGAEGKLSYLPGPFGPLELGRERMANDQQRYPSPGPYPQTPASGGAEGPYNAAMQTPYKARIRPAPSPSFLQPPASPGFLEESPTRQGPSPYTNQPLVMGPSQSLAAFHPRVQSLSQAGTESPSQTGQTGSVSRTPTPALDIASMQAEIDAAHEHAAAAARETLFQIFPGVDREVVEWVLEANAGDLGKSIEGLLEVSSGT